jgi:hypothetical protein
MSIAVERVNASASPSTTAAKPEESAEESTTSVDEQTDSKPTSESSATVFAERNLTDSVPQRQSVKNAAVAEAPASGIFGCDDGLCAETNKAAADYVRLHRNEIFAAASKYNVEPETVASLLFQEQRFYDDADKSQDAIASDWLNGKGGAGSFQSYVDSDFFRKLGAGMLRPVDEVSFGPAQIQLRNAKELIDLGYLDGMVLPNGTTFDRATQWNNLSNDDKDRLALTLLLDPSKSVELTAAWNRYTIDDWVARGGDPRVETDPQVQYSVLNQLYSFYDPGTSRANPNPTTSYQDMSTPGQDAVSNFSVIWKALYTNDAFPDLARVRAVCAAVLKRANFLAGNRGRLVAGILQPFRARARPMIMQIKANN